MSLPGLRAGLTFVFLMASSTYVSARMLGGRSEHEASSMHPAINAAGAVRRVPRRGLARSVMFSGDRLYWAAM